MHPVVFMHDVSRIETHLFEGALAPVTVELCRAWLHLTFAIRTLHGVPFCKYTGSTDCFDVGTVSRFNRIFVALMN